MTCKSASCQAGRTEGEHRPYICLHETSPKIIARPIRWLEIHFVGLKHVQCATVEQLCHINRQNITLQ